MKKTLKPDEIITIQQNANILRAYPLFPISLANQINALGIAVLPAIKKMAEMVDLINDRKLQFGKMLDGEEKKKVEQNLLKDIGSENKRKYDVVFTPIPIALFTEFDITGVKEVQNEEGIIKYHYRDAYYDLINEGLIQ